MHSKCPSCGFKNRRGVLFCEDCGYQLTADADATARRPDLRHVVSQHLGLNRKTEPLDDGFALVLHIRNESEPLVVPLGTDQVTLGRLDNHSTYQVDIDLTVYGALQKGVSRFHAVFFRDEHNMLLVVDMESANGTYLNGHRLPPQQPFAMSSGDEVMLGKLRMHVYFEKLALTRH